MTLSAWIILSTAIVVGSFLSGVFGMAGGMVVIGVLLIYFDVPTAMILYSIIQLAANGWRAMQWWSYVRWRIVWLYCLGGLVAFAAMRLVQFVPDKALVYLLLGLTPFAVDVLPKSWRPDIEWRGVSFITGIFTTIIQFISGVGGLFLDIFFQKSMLDRKTTLATKAVVQSASHVLRLFYFVSLTGIGAGLEPVPVLGAVVLAIGVTMLAPYVIERMTDDGFRQWTRFVIYTICIVYLLRAGWLYWQG
ncbi:MAG TPA: sulfite exporter TauE/SafE family protein [Xanthobacteraceae bacterium]|nr:sulfite exporter TauE/SafE family protein [Xanthobacteraceae bacterium]